MSEAPGVDGYIATAPAAAQPLLRELRQILLLSVPGVTEKISYGMPTYIYAGKRLAYLAAAKSHVAVYAVVHEDAGVPDELAAYADHRSTLHFAFDKPIPAAAIRRAIRGKARSLKDS